MTAVNLIASPSATQTDSAAPLKTTRVHSSHLLSHLIDANVIHDGINHQLKLVYAEQFHSITSTLCGSEINDSYIPTLAYDRRMSGEQHHSDSKLN